MDRPTPRIGGISFWYSSAGLPSRRPALDADRDADVCIVGAGFIGLWTAYYLKQAAPARCGVLGAERTNPAARFADLLSGR